MYVVAIDDNVAQIDANAEAHPFRLRQIRLDAGHQDLNLTCALRGRHDASEFNQRAVAHKLHDPPAVPLEVRLENARPDVLEARQRTGLILLHEAAVAGDIGRHDYGEAALQHPRIRSEV